MEKAISRRCDWIKSLVGAAALAAGVTVGHQANASAVFQDDFNSYSGGLSVTNFGGWTVNQGSVDLIPVGAQYNFYPGNGTYVDLNGSTGQYGGISTVQSFAPGNYTLTFNLGGSVGGDGNIDPSPKTTIVSLGDWNMAILLAPNAGFTNQSFTFSTPDGGTLNFVSQAGGNPNVGNILDNVVLNDPPATPLPSTWSMLIAGFAGLGFVAYLGSKRQKRGSPANVAAAT